VTVAELIAALQQANPAADVFLISDVDHHIDKVTGGPGMSVYIHEGAAAGEDEE